MIVNGKQIAEEVLAELKNEILALRPLRQAHGRQAQGKPLRLAAILVGDDEEFKKFVELKGRKAEEIGIEFKMFQFDENMDEAAMIYHSAEICKNYDGVLFELPLPKHLDQQKILDVVPVEKDVDVLSSTSQHRFYADSECGLDADSKKESYEVRPRGFFEVEPQALPPAVEALKIVLEKYGIGLKDKKAAVFGQGALVGKPISHWLEQEGAEVYRIRSTTENQEEYSRQADIIVTGVGKPGLIKGDMVKNGVIVIDFGYGKNAEGKMRGDVDFDSVAPKASLITPVPGGMGPILIAAVLKNLVKLSS